MISIYVIFYIKLMYNSSIDEGLLNSLGGDDYIVETNGVRRLSLLKDVLLFE